MVTRSMRDSVDTSRFPSSFWLVLSIPWLYRSLLFQLIRRDVVGRYRGSAMGVLWSFAHPLLMLAVYTTVFGTFLKSRWAGSDNSWDFSIILFVGLIVFNFFAECVNRAPGLIIANTNYVKKIIFPLEIFPWVVVGSALFHAVVSLLVWTVFYIVMYGFLHWTLIFLPCIFLPLLLIVVGMSWFLSATGVYLRDLSHITSIVTTVLMFLSPIFYATSTLPVEFRTFLLANPLTFIVEQCRAVMIRGDLPNFLGLAIYSGISLSVAWLGLVWFQKTREGFADVL